MNSSWQASSASSRFPRMFMARDMAGAEYLSTIIRKSSILPRRQPAISSCSSIRCSHPILRPSPIECLWGHHMNFRIFWAGEIRKLIWCPRFKRAKTYSARCALKKALAGEAPRFEKGKGSGAKEDPSPASSIISLLLHFFSNVKENFQFFLYNVQDG